jgi:hypothetical protein
MEDLLGTLGISRRLFFHLRKNSFYFFKAHPVIFLSTSGSRLSSIGKNNIVQMWNNIVVSDWNFPVLGKIYFPESSADSGERGGWGNKLKSSQCYENKKYLMFKFTSVVLPTQNIFLTSIMKENSFTCMGFFETCRRMFLENGIFKLLKSQESIPRNLFRQPM